MERKLRILIVEDDDTTRKALQRLFRDEGYEVAIASNGVEALEVILRDSPFDLVLSDNDMPKMSGITLLKRLKEYRSTKDTPFILQSSGGDETLQLQCVENGGTFRSETTKQPLPELVRVMLAALRLNS